MVGAIRQLSPVSFALITSPSRPRKVMGVGVAGRLLGVQVKVRGRVCYPCYTKPEATAARKKIMAEKKAVQGLCSTPDSTGINHKGRGKCQRYLYDY